MRILIILVLLLSSIYSTAQQSIVLQPDSTKGKDAWIWSLPQYSSVNFGVLNKKNGGLNNVIRSEVWQWAANRSDTIRSLIYFDLSILPQKAIVDSAKLNLYYFKNPKFTSHTGENQSFIHPIIESWNEADVTWQNQPDYDSSISVELPKSLSSTQNYIEIDVTSLVNDQIKSQHYGWLIKLQNEKGFNGLTFASSDHHDTSLRPSLTVYYH